MMHREYCLAVLLVFSLFTSAVSQTPSVKPSQPQKPDDESVVRISTNLVQIDVRITDKDGVQITDLKPEEVEIYEDGHLQKISAFSYVGLSTTLRSVVDSTANGNNAIGAPNRPAPPPVRLRPDQVHRTIALLVDDKCMSMSSVFAVEVTLKDFLAKGAKGIEPNDMIGIFRTAKTNSMLQQFTTDRNQLALAARRLNWIPGQCTPIDLFEPTRRDFYDLVNSVSKEIPGRPEIGQRTRFGSPGLSAPALVRSEYFGTEGRESEGCSAMRFLLHDMSRLPGRKALVLFSEEIVGCDLPLISDYANRSGVTIYTVHAPGLVNTDYIGADEDVTSSDVSSDRTTQLRNSRGRAFFSSQGGLNYLAEHTGGTFTHNNNDLSKGLRRALEEQRGYYLIGYRPSDDTFKNGLRSFHKIEVKVNRPNVRVRTRKGFIGVPDETLMLPPRPRTENSELYEALASPLAHDDVRLRLTPDVSYEANGKPRFRALLHIDASDITFADEANGWKRLTLDVAGVMLAEDGRVANEFTRTHTVRIGPETVDLVRANGLTYSSDVPIERFGAYQFRIVVRDAASKKYGTAAQFLQIPDLKKRTLTVSDLRLRPDDPVGAQEMPSATPIEAALSLVLSPSNPAVRRFRAGTAVAFEQLIYNARSDKSGQPHLTTQVRLFREGQEIFSNPEKPLDLSGQLTVGRILNRGRLHLPAQAEPGEYVLQIIVNDDAPGEKRRTTSQWIDFEIMK